MASVDVEHHQPIIQPPSGDGSQYEPFEAEPPENARPALRPVSRQYQFSILICAFLDVVLTIGMNQAYGVFLTYYLDPTNNEREAFLPSRQLKSKALIAFVGTLAAGLTWGGSIFVNPLMTKTKDPRTIPLVGAVLIGLGYVLASFTHNVRLHSTAILKHQRITHLLTCPLDLATTADSRPHLRGGYINALLPLPRGCTRVLRRPPRLCHGLHTLRVGRGRLNLRSRYASTAYQGRRSVDVESAGHRQFRHSITRRLEHATGTHHSPTPYTRQHQHRQETRFSPPGARRDEPGGRELRALDFSPRV